MVANQIESEQTARVDRPLNRVELAQALKVSLSTVDRLLADESNGSNLLLQWPPSGIGFALYTTTNLIPTANWLLATNQAAFVNGQWQISLANDALASRFYRLQAE